MNIRMNIKLINQKNTIKYFLIALLFAGISCTRDELSNGNNSEPFGIIPIVSRHDITPNSNVNFLPNVTSERSMLFKNTEELFSFLNNVIDVGKKHNNEDLIKLGHNLADKFYGGRDHFTYFNSNKTPYSYLFFDEDAKQEDVIINYIKNLSLNYLPEIKKVIENMRITSFTPIENYENYDPSRYFIAISNFVSGIDDQLKRRTLINETVADAIGSIAEDEFIPMINMLGAEVETKIHMGNTLEQNIANAREIINNNDFLVGTQIYENILLELDKAEGRRLSWTEWIAIRIFRQKIDNETFLIGIANFLVENLDKVPAVIADVFEQKFNEVLNDDKLFRETTHLVMSGMFDEIVFDGGHAPAIEFSNIQTFLDSENQVTFDKPRVSADLKITTASTWALSIPLMLERLSNLRELNKNTVTLEYNKILFSLINKSTSAIGYIKDADNFYEGLFFPFDETDGTPRIDVRTYYSDDNWPYLGMPDSMTIRNGFEIDQDLTNVPNMRTSVSAQADYISAMSDVLEFLRPDRDFSSFDISLGREIVLDFSIFPKDSIFLMHLGLTSIPFTNLKKKGVRGYDETGEHKALTASDLEKPDNIYMISINDIIDSGQTNKIVTKDIAKFIIAVDKLLKFFNSINIDNIEDQYLKEVFSGDIYEDSTDLMRQMMLGLGLFLTAKMQLPEGGFYDSYYLDTNFGEQTYSLDTQVSAIRGLLAMHNHKWESDLVKLVISDTYRTMNNKLFDEDLGFYRINEKQKSMPDLKLTLETIQMLYELDTILPKEDLNNLRNNRQYWLEKFVEQVSDLQ